MKYEENSVLELKEQINADFKKEIIAFANTNGGEIYVGVARDGSITGVENPEAEMEKIGNMIRDGIKPDLTAYTSIERIEESGKSLICVTVSRVAGRCSHEIRVFWFLALWRNRSCPASLRSAPHLLPSHLANRYQRFLSHRRRDSLRRTEHLLRGAGLSQYSPLLCFRRPFPYR